MNTYPVKFNMQKLESENGCRISFKLKELQIGILVM